MSANIHQKANEAMEKMKEGEFIAKFFYQTFWNWLLVIFRKPVLLQICQ